MIKKDELTDPASCLSRAADDEPIFVLRSNDKRAADVVRKWAVKYRQDKKAEGEWDERARAKFCEAVDMSLAMDEWREREQATTSN